MGYGGQSGAAPGCPIHQPEGVAYSCWFVSCWPSRAKPCPADIPSFGSTPGVYCRRFWSPITGLRLSNRHAGRLVPELFWKARRSLPAACPSPLSVSTPLGPLSARPPREGQTKEAFSFPDSCCFLTQRDSERQLASCNKLSMRILSITFDMHSAEYQPVVYLHTSQTGLVGQIP